MSVTEKHIKNKIKPLQNNYLERLIQLQNMFHLPLISFN